MTPDFPFKCLRGGEGHDVTVKVDAIGQRIIDHNQKTMIHVNAASVIKR